MPPKYKEVVKRLRDESWYLDRQNGSHQQFRHAAKSTTVTVAGAGHGSKTVPHGTWQNIKRQAGWDQ